MLLILYIGFKDKTLALLLGIAYTLSVHTLNISRLESTNIEKPYIDPPSDIEESSSDVLEAFEGHETLKRPLEALKQGQVLSSSDVSGYVVAARWQERQKEDP